MKLIVTFLYYLFPNTKNIELEKLENLLASIHSHFLLYLSLFSEYTPMGEGNVLARRLYTYSQVQPLMSHWNKKQVI
jgi:hypothetical protein